jgi:hypothetical protein
MKNAMAVIFKCVGSFFYFSIVLAFIFGFFDSQVIGGIVPSFMAKDLRAEARLYLIFLNRAAQAAPTGNPYDFRVNAFNPKGGLKSAVGVNPDCFPGIPVNTYAVARESKLHSDFKPNFHYSDKYLNDGPTQKVYEEFFRHLPCPKPNDLNFYAVVTGQKYNAQWTFFQKINDAGELILIDSNGNALSDYTFVILLFAILGIFGLSWVNYKVFRERKWSYLEYPNYVLIILFVLSCAAGINNLHFWVPRWTFF